MEIKALVIGFGLAKACRNAVIPAIMAALDPDHQTDVANGEDG